MNHKSLDFLYWDSLRPDYANRTTMGGYDFETMDKICRIVVAAAIAAGDYPFHHEIQK